MHNLIQSGCYNEIKARDYRAMRDYLWNVDHEAPASDDECPYTDAGDFLQGSCQLFSLALHKKYGYEAFEIRSADGFHCFCKAIYKGKIVYIDVRGITSDFDDFLCGLAFVKKDYEVAPQDIERDSRLCDEWDAVGMAYAERIIEKNPEFYDVKSL